MEDVAKEVIFRLVDYGIAVAVLVLMVGGLAYALYRVGQKLITIAESAIRADNEQAKASADLAAAVSSLNSRLENVETDQKILISVINAKGGS